MTTATRGMHHGSVVGQDRRSGASRRRRTIAWALLESAAAVAALLVSYALLPLDSGVRGQGVTFLLIGLGVFGFVVYYQIRTVVLSANPVLRAIRALVVAVPLFLLLFATTYVLMSHSSHGSFSKPLDHIGGFYFAVTVFSTVGFGDIVPVSDTARVVVAGQMLADLIVIGGVLKLMVGAVRVNRQRAAHAAGGVERSASDATGGI